MALELTPRFRPKNVLAALTMVSVLLLTTGCGEEDQAGQLGTGSSTGTDSNRDGDGKDGKDADGDKAASKDAILTGVECFPGNWIVDNAGIQAYMQALSGAENVTTTGRVLLTYKPDGTTQTNYDHWTNTVKISEGTSIVERHGSDKGKYTASAHGNFSLSDTSIGSVTTMTVNGPTGQIVSMSVDPEPSVFDEGKYTCSGDLLTMHVDGYDLAAQRER